FNVTHGKSQGSLVVQIPFVVSKLNSLLLQVISDQVYQTGIFEFTLNSTVKAKEAEVCVARQHGSGGRRKVLTLQMDLLEAASVWPALQTFMKYVEDIANYPSEDNAFLEPGNLTSVQMFYVAYAMHFCENSESNRLRRQNRFEPFSLPAERVNIPLKNLKDF